jgi:hypothetical protein
MGGNLLPCSKGEWKTVQSFFQRRTKRMSGSNVHGGGTVPSRRASRRFLPAKRTWGVLAAAVVLGTGIVIPAASFADTPSGCDFSPANNGTQGCLGPLPGSTFAGGDGNLLTNPTTFGTTDWQNVAGLNPGFDLPSGTGDNAFGQGTKEDNPNVTVVTGSIPPNKSNLTRFYEASEIGTNNDNFLYLAWERSNVLGSANMDFEINQKTTAGFNGSTTGPVTLNRTAGDLLVTFDFTNGGGKPAIGLLRWLTSATTPVVPGFAPNVCFSSNTFPCWGDQLTLDGTDSIGAVNNLDSVTDPLFPSSPNYINPLPPLQFGETAIDLTKAGVFPPGTCEAFGSAFVKSRASASFGAEVKDFIAPIKVNISNCGSIKIIKHTDPRGKDQVFSYTSNLPAEPPSTVGGVAQGGVKCPGNSSAGVQADGSFCLNDAGNSTGDSAGNTVYNNALQAGKYTVTEGGDPSGFTFEKLSCTGGTTSTNGKTATITLAPGDQVVCTYTNQLNTATMTTQVSTTNQVFPGQPVNDTATVTGNQAADTPSGTVTFFLCSISGVSGSCSSGGMNIGTGMLSGSGATASATSPNVNTSASPLTPGLYCFRAEWPGDNNYPAVTEFGGASGTNECFTVKVIPTTTVSTPSPGSGGTTTFGSSVTDSALVTATQSGDGTPTGTVKFFVCKPGELTSGACPTGGTQVGNPVPTTAVSGSSPPASTATSDAITANITGTWCFRAVYTPDVSTYTGSSDATSGECFTVTDTTTSTSAQDWLPNDTATVSSANGAPLNGTLSAQLFTGDNCGAISGGPVSNQTYTKTLSGTSSSATLTTGNTTFKVTTPGASFSWLVKFKSSDSNVADSSHCESSSLTISD